MDRLRQLLQQIGAQLSVLTTSQRVAIGACAALAAASFLWLMQWSSATEFVPLVTREFSFDELDMAESALDAEGISNEVRGSRLYVRPMDRHNALRLVHGADALPEGSLFDMESVVNNTNPFVSPDARTYAQTYAKGNELAKIIASSPYVKKASVILNPVTRRRLGGATDLPTASVTVTLASGKEMTQEIVQGFAKLVAGAVTGLRPHNVYITDARTLRSYSAPDPEDAASFNVLSMIKEREEHYRAKILAKLADIPSVQVAVTVDLDMSRRVTTSVKHDDPQPKTEKSISSEQSTARQPSEVGVQANMGRAITSGRSGQSSNTSETTVENFDPKLSHTETVEQMPFSLKSITAAVGIPRSFIIGVYRVQYPNAEEDVRDDDPEFISVRDAQVMRVKSSVERIVMAKSPDDVEVDVYPDMEWTAEGGVWSRAPGAVGLAQAESQVEDTLTMARTYAPQIGLGVLALMSLMMMLRIARKAAEVVPPRRRFDTTDEVEEEEEEAVSLAVGPAAIGQAEVSDSMLAGKELDSETLRYQELGQEVTKMVDNDPRGAAELIRRWVDET